MLIQHHVLPFLYTDTETGEVLEICGCSNEWETHIRLLPLKSTLTYGQDKISPNPRF